MLVWTSLADILYSLVLSEAQARVLGVQKLLRLSRLLRLFKLVKSIKVGEGGMGPPSRVCRHLCLDHLLACCDGLVTSGGSNDCWQVLHSSLSCLVCRPMLNLGVHAPVGRN